MTAAVIQFPARVVERTPRPRPAEVVVLHPGAAYYQAQANKLRAESLAAFLRLDYQRARVLAFQADGYARDAKAMKRAGRL